jgi:hypothetical protein
MPHDLVVVQQILGRAREHLLGSVPSDQFGELQVDQRARLAAIAARGVRSAFQPRNPESGMNETIAILGGTGVYARHLVPRLAARGYRVRALVRRPEAAGVARSCGAEVRVADIFDADSLEAALVGCAVGTSPASPALPSLPMAVASASRRSASGTPAPARRSPGRRPTPTIEPASPADLTVQPRRVDSIPRRDGSIRTPRRGR